MTGDSSADSSAGEVGFTVISHDSPHPAPVWVEKKVDNHSLFNSAAAAMASFSQLFSIVLLLSSALSSSYAAPHHSSLTESSSTDRAAAITSGAAGETATNDIPSNEDSAAPRRVIFGKFPDPICKRFGGCTEPIDPVDDPIDPTPCSVNSDAGDHRSTATGAAASETHRVAVAASAAREVSP
ncbi:unnamed protein product [Closterium sp. Yama58-4]|nr:unnamed protein product [Closterium sp. Yama58-4]